MNAKEFNKIKTALYKKYGAELTDFSHEVKVLTPFGTLYVSAEWTPRIKVANIHSKLKGDAKQFKEVTGYDITTYNGKCNFYSADPEWILDTLDEYLDNMQYLSGEKRN
jgi:hypothetical protein